jgi:hypothetical protein
MDRDRSNRPRFNPGITLAIVLLLAGLGLFGIVWANYRYAEITPGGTDFLVHWVGMRVILKGENPYSDATALEIQTLVYGRAARPGEHELRVAYPLYAEFLFLPFALIPDFSWARALWMAVLEIGAAGFAVLSLALAGSGWPRWQHFCFILFSILWYFGARAIINGNAIVLVSLFVGIAIFCAKKNRNVAAGIFLACCTIKPQVAVIPILSVLLWGIWTRRFRMIFSFGAAMVLFTAVSFAILPSWLADNWREIMRFPAYNPPGTPADALQSMFGTRGYWTGGFLSILVWISILYAWISLFRLPEKNALFLIGMTVLLSPLSGIQTDPGNEFILLLPLALVLAGKSLPGGSPIRFTAILGTIFFGIWILFILTVQKGGQPVQHPVMLFPLPMFLLLVIGLDWIRKRMHPTLAPG